MTSDSIVGVLTDSGIPPDDRAALAGMLVDAYLLGVARGRDELTREQNGTYPPAPIRHLGQWIDQADERAKWYADAATARPGDHAGGPVNVW